MIIVTGSLSQTEQQELEAADVRIPPIESWSDRIQLLKEAYGEDQVVPFLDLSRLCHEILSFYFQCVKDDCPVIYESAASCISACCAQMKTVLPEELCRDVQEYEQSISVLSELAPVVDGNVTVLQLKDEGFTGSFFSVCPNLKLKPYNKIELPKFQEARQTARRLQFF